MSIKSIVGWVRDLLGFEKNKTNEIIVDLYKVEPNIKEMIPETAELPKEVKIKKETKTKEVKIKKDKVKKETKTKTKRKWYNNGKAQKLIPIDEKVPKGWKKGRLPKEKKDK